MHAVRNQLDMRELLKPTESFDISDDELFERFMRGNDLPQYEVIATSAQRQQTLGFLDYPENEANACLAAGADKERAEEAIFRLHFGITKIMGQHLSDGRISARNRAAAIRWFQEVDSPPPDWHLFTFSTYCWLAGADQEALRTEIYRRARLQLKSGQQDES